MKKIILALVVLMFAAPAWADVDITCTDLGDGKVLVSFDARTEDPNLVRAFGLNIQCDNDANIVDVNDQINTDYWVFPGTIVITGNEVTYQGTAVGEVSDSPDTLPGPPDGNGVTIECGSLYYPTGPGSVNAPDPCGPLLTFTVDKNTCITISGNVARAGSTGVVMENPDDDPTVNFPTPGAFCVVLEVPTCWDATECAGQPNGDATCDGVVNLNDLAALKAAWGMGAPYTPPHCCADFTQDGAVNLNDLAALKAGWGTGGYLPSTLNQSCP